MASLARLQAHMTTVKNLSLLMQRHARYSSESNERQEATYPAFWQKQGDRHGTERAEPNILGIVTLVHRLL